MTWGKVIHICNNKYRRKWNTNIFYKRAFSTYVNKSATDIAITIYVLSIGIAEKQCLQTGRVCDVMEIPQSRMMATATSRPPARDIRDTVNPPKGFDQSAMLTSYRVWDYYICLVAAKICAGYVYLKYVTLVLQNFPNDYINCLCNLWPTWSLVNQFVASMAPLCVFAG